MDCSNIDIREDPKEIEIREMMRIYPNLDWLMCKTLLSFSEEQLGDIIEKSKDIKVDNSFNSVQKSVFINDNYKPTII
tara:strand:- start:407 stop:640 length:234 start_codon:yes stop_codon:yes gene_type:complete